MRVWCLFKFIEWALKEKEIIMEFILMKMINSYWLVFIRGACCHLGIRNGLLVLYYS